MYGTGIPAGVLKVTPGIPFSEMSDEVRVAWMRLYAKVLGDVGEGDPESRVKSWMPRLLTGDTGAGVDEESEVVFGFGDCVSGCSRHGVGSSVDCGLDFLSGACECCRRRGLATRNDTYGAAGERGIGSGGEIGCLRVVSSRPVASVGSTGRVCGEAGGEADRSVSNDSFLAGGVGRSEGVGDEVDSDRGVVVETKTERNRRWRCERRARKSKRKAMSFDWRVKSAVEQEASDSLAKLRILENNKRIQSIENGADVDPARVSLRKKWEAENLLAAEQATRKLLAIKAAKIEDEEKKYATALRAGIERNMVSIEKTHATLVATGNVPAGFQGYAETETSSGSEPNGGIKSGTISPNSSISEAEVRAMQKQILDMELSLTKYRQVTGLSLAAVENCQKRVWTDNSENHAILEELYPMGYGIDTTGFPEGKFRPT